MISIIELHFNRPTMSQSSSSNVRSQDDKFICRCSTVCGCKESLRRHMEEECSKIPKFICGLCHSVFVDPSHRNYHVLYCCPLRRTVISSRVGRRSPIRASALQLAGEIGNIAQAEPAVYTCK